jgi:exopolysaccharide biosynthesis protein
MKIYDETQTNAQELLDTGVWNTLSFGPALIENGVTAANFSMAIGSKLGKRLWIEKGSLKDQLLISSARDFFINVSEKP